MALSRKYSYIEFIGDIKPFFDTLNGKRISKETVNEIIDDITSTIKNKLLIAAIDSKIYDSLKSLETPIIGSYYFRFDSEYDEVGVEITLVEDDDSYNARVKEWEFKQANKPSKEEKAKIKKEKELASKKALFLKLKEELGE